MELAAWLETTAKTGKGDSYEWLARGVGALRDIGLGSFITQENKVKCHQLVPEFKYEIWHLVPALRKERMECRVAVALMLQQKIHGYEEYRTKLHTERQVTHQEWMDRVPTPPGFESDGE